MRWPSQVLARIKQRSGRVAALSGRCLMRACGCAAMHPVRDADPAAQNPAAPYKPDASEEDKKLYGHMFDDLPPKGGAEEGSEGGSDDSLLSSGEEGSEGEEEEEGWSDEEAGEEEEGRGHRRKADELDELFGQVGTAPFVCWLLLVKVPWLVGPLHCCCIDAESCLG